MDFTALSMLLLAMLLCSSCFSELGARDLDEEEKEKPGLKGRADISVPLEHEHLSRSGHLDTQLGTPRSPLPFLEKSSHHPARRGNWCAFVHQRLVNVAGLSDPEKHIVKEVNPCVNDDPDCQTLKYQLTSRPAYKQKQKTITALQWKCCPGHGGSNCQETVSLMGESQSSQEHPEKAPTQADDFESGNGGNILPSSSLPFIDSSSLLAFHQIFATVMTQLQPVLDGFNHTLENLSRDVEGLSIELKSLRQEQESISKARQAHEEKFEKYIEGSTEQMQKIWKELDSQQKEIKQTIQLQQDHLLHNMTDLKNKTDHYVNMNHEEMQVSLQSMNKSVEEIRLNYKSLQETTQGGHAVSANASGSQSPLETSVWEAISSLDMKVLNNTMELSPLTENAKHLVNIVQKLDHGFRNLSQNLEHVNHNTELNLAQIKFEVDAARVTMQKIINDQTSNLSTQERELREIQLDVDNIYQHLQNIEHASEICNCKEISDSLIRLEWEVANVTNLAKENRYALEDVEAKRGLNQWAPEVQDLHQGLWNIRESLAFEQGKRKTLDDNIAQLKSSLLDSQKEIVGFKDQFVVKEAEIRHLFAVFTSLLKDVIRHSEVLEVLLGDEVLEFSSWSNSKQKELVIPELLQKMRLMQEKIDSHENRLTSLRKSSTEKSQMSNDDPAVFTEWSLAKGQGSNTEDNADTLTDVTTREDDEDYSVSDFWSLGREVEQLANRLSMLEQQPCNHTAVPSGSVAELQRDVRTLQQTLEDHLRTFRNLFKYTEKLASSSDGVNLDQLQTMMRTKERRGKKRPNVRRMEETSSKRSRRNIGEKFKAVMA
ncbi:multimerin-2-like isoform X2 [Clarias magur]|uniref:Multimerin-2-like isoform X2 n=1 Tax=Clarias magur TaxID=1594786 RepID=A0A8J4XF13_CLAMG|nr:multimerin-2-like isoform X2 [Clarias magur]